MNQKNQSFQSLRPDQLICLVVPIDQPKWTNHSYSSTPVFSSS